MAVYQLSLGKLKGDSTLVAKGKAEEVKVEAEEKTGETVVTKGKAEVTKGKRREKGWCCLWPLGIPVRAPDARLCWRCCHPSHTPSRYAATASHPAFFARVTEG